MTAPETAEVRLKRLGMRSWRRGTKEMDLILGPYADACLTTLGAQALDAYEAFMDENDKDLYAWVTGQIEAPPKHSQTIKALRTFHAIATL